MGALFHPVSSEATSFRDGRGGGDGVLTHLAQVRGVSASTQNQALCALLFLYRHVLGRLLGALEGLVWAKRSTHVPGVLTPDEVVCVLDRLSGTPWLVAALLYGAGLRLSECLELRVKDLDVGGHQIVVRSGKGQKDRRTTLPESLVESLEQHLRVVHRLHARDRHRGFGRVSLPDALAVKYPRRRRSGGGSLCFRRAGSAAIRGGVRRPAITCTSPRCSARSRRRRGRRASTSGCRAIRSGIRLRRICWKVGRTFVRCKSYWVTGM